MLRERILDMFREQDPDVRKVIARVLEEEWAHLSYQRPRIMEEIRQIIEAEVESNEA